MAPATTHYDLLEAFAEEGCPVCRLTLVGVARYIAAVNYESVGDAGIRAQLRASFGFCQEHAYQWLRAAHVLGTAQIYIDVLERLTEEVQSLSFRRRGVMAGVASLLAPRGEQGASDNGDCAWLQPAGQCPVCLVRIETERMGVETLLHGLREPEFRDTYAASEGLCLPHLRLALCIAQDQATFKTLRDVATARQRFLIGQLHEIVRKHDYRFHDEPAGEEKGAGARAVRHVVGLREPR